MNAYYALPFKQDDGTVGYRYDHESVKKMLTEYADQEVKKAIQKAYCAGYINGAGEYGSVVDPIADGKLKDALTIYLQSIT